MFAIFDIVCVCALLCSTFHSFYILSKYFIINFLHNYYLAENYSRLLSKFLQATLFWPQFRTTAGILICHCSRIFIANLRLKEHAENIIIYLLFQAKQKKNFSYLLTILYTKNVPRQQHVQLIKFLLRLILLEIRK